MPDYGQNGKQSPTAVVPIGRPSGFNEEIAEKILALVAENISLRKISAIEGMPAVSTICLWLTKSQSFSEQYARAKQIASELMGDEILDIADNIGKEHMDTIETAFGEIPNKEWIARSKVRVDARFKLMQLLYPKKYGPRLATEISGPDGAPLAPPRDESDMAKFAAMMEKAREKTKEP